jgi:hypothetical protein
LVINTITPNYFEIIIKEEFRIMSMAESNENSPESKKRSQCDDNPFSDKLEQLEIEPEKYSKVGFS